MNLKHSIFSPKDSAIYNVTFNDNYLYNVILSKINLIEWELKDINDNKILLIYIYMNINQLYYI